MPARATRAGRGAAREDLVQLFILRALDSARVALFGHAMGNPGVVEALRRAQHELAGAEIHELEQLRRAAPRLTVDRQRRRRRGARP